MRMHSTSGLEQGRHALVMTRPESGDAHHSGCGDPEGCDSSPITQAERQHERRHAGSPEAGEPRRTGRDADRCDRSVIEGDDAP